MIWLYPTAAIALAGIIGPILVHILVRQRAARIAFPTLRFIQPHRFASARRRALEDGILLAVRIAILATAVAALAGPLLVTAARRAAWDRTVHRVEVADQDLSQGLVRAVAALALQPPGRREIVVRSTFPLGSLSARDVAAVPPQIGLRFVRTATLPAARTLSAPAVVQNGRIIARETTLAGALTSVRDVDASGNASSGASTPSIEIVAAAKTSGSALEQWLFSERLPTPLPGRAARAFFDGAKSESSPISKAWMANATAQISHERGTPDDVRFAASGDRLSISTAIAPDDPRAKSLVRAIARALAAPAEQPDAEILAIDDAQLQRWSRPADPMVTEPVENLERDDRRWLWGAVLLLLGVEWSIRRARRSSATGLEAPRAA